MSDERMREALEAKAQKIARCVRGCATDEQYCELIDNIVAALSQEGGAAPLEQDTQKAASSKVFKTTVLGIGPWCVEFPDGEIVTCRTEERALQIAQKPSASREEALREAAKVADMVADGDAVRAGAVAVARTIAADIRALLTPGE